MSVSNPTVLERLKQEIDSLGTIIDEDERDNFMALKSLRDSYSDVKSGFEELENKLDKANEKIGELEEQLSDANEMVELLNSQLKV